MQNFKFILLIAALFGYSSVFAQWTTKTVGVNEALTGVHFPSDNIGFIVGARGSILKSIDAGESWNTVYTNLNPNFPLKSVYFINDSIGFAGGKQLLKTIDGGNTWNSIDLSNQATPNPGVTKILFTTSQIGFFVTMSGIYKTVDGGNTWALKSAIHSKSIHFPSQNIGYVYANGLVNKTTDGGETWNLLSATPQITNVAAGGALFFTTEDTGYFGGNYYSVFTKTTTGGNTWDCMASDCFRNTHGNGISSIHFPSLSTGYAIKNNSTTGGIVHKTIDAGSTWSADTVNATWLNDVYFRNENVGYIVGRTGVNGSFIAKMDTRVTSSAATTAPNNIKVYPNPTAHCFNIDIEDGTQLPLNFQITTVLGQNLLNKSLSLSSNSIDLSKFTNGIYIYTLLNADNKIVKQGKIVKD